MSGKILFVEDSPNIRDMCVRILSNAGYEVESAATGQEAVRLLRSDPAFDLVVIDFALPDMSGLELIDHVRSRIPAIIISGYLSLQDRDSIATIEHCEVLLKPFQPQELIAAVERTLGR